jgi:1,2-diacylglycerol 3-alpha-glucosyltransferase
VTVQNQRCDYKIAMVAASPFPYPQGSQVLIGQLAAALHRRGHQVRLVAYHSGIGQPPEGVPVQRIRSLPGLGTTRAGPSWRKPLLDLLLAWELLRVVREWEPDVIHVHSFEGGLAAFFVRWLAGVPVVYHVHNAMGLELHTYFRSRLGRWAGRVVGRWVDSHLPRRADYCILLNDRAVDYFRQQGVKRLQVVSPGIDFEPGDAARVRQQLGDGPLILYSGNLDHYQDLHLLLEAFRLLADDRPDSRLIMSTNAAPAPWQARAEAMGIGRQTIFIPTDDFGVVRDLLAAADVAVCPRRTCLGFPIKLLNYMAAARAIVVSAGSACGLRHLENGWVVDNGDIAGMAAAIATLLDDPALARRLGESARRTVLREHTWDRAVEATEQIYQQVERALQAKPSYPVGRSS